MRRAQAGKRRHKVDAARRVGGVTQVGNFLGVVDELQVVAQPGLNSAGVAHVALEHVLGHAVHAPRERARKPVRAGDKLVTDIHHDRAAGAIRGLGHATAVAALCKQGGVAVAQHAVNGHGRRQKAAQVRRAEQAVGIGHLRQAGRVDTEGFAHRLAPAAATQVEELRATGVGPVATELGAARERPDHPSVNRAKAKLARRSGLSSRRRVCENPSHLARRIVGREHQTRRVAHQLGHALAGGQLVTQFTGAGALPHHGVAQRLARRTVPGNGGLTLVGNANAGDVGRVDPGLLHHGARHGQNVGRDLSRIMAHPAGLVDDLAMRAVGTMNQMAALVHQQRLGALRRLIDSDDVFAHVLSHSFRQSKDSLADKE